MYRSDMVIDYIPYKNEKRVSCLLTGVDFYDGIFTLYPIPTEVNEYPTTFRAHFSNCEFPVKPLKIVES